MQFAYLAGNDVFDAVNLNPVHVLCALHHSTIRPQLGRGYKCTPAKFAAGRAQPRETFAKYVGALAA
jgi:hypothetical protein